MPTWYELTVIRNSLVIPMQGGGKFTVSPIRGLELVDSRGRVAFSVSAEGHVSIGANATYGNTSYLSIGGSTPGADVSFGFRINGGVLEYRDTAGNWIALSYYGDHGNLTGLGDDDHPHYALVDGTRAFTGQVSVPSLVSYGSNGQLTTLAQASAQSAALSGATHTFTNLIPAGALVLGVTTRVTTAVTGATTFDVGDGTDVDRWANATAITLDSTTDGTDFTIQSPQYYQAATSVVLTANGSNFTGGVVRATVHYISFTAETS